MRAREGVAGLVETPTIGTHMPLELLGAVRARFPSLEIVGLPSEGPVDVEGAIDVLLTLPWGTPNLAEVLRLGVRWVHAYGTGVNGFPFEGLEGVPLTCSRGASATSISEWVMAVLLAAEKRLPQTWLDAPPERWNVAELGTLRDRHLGRLRLLERPCAPRGSDLRDRHERHRGRSHHRVHSLRAGADHVVVAAPETPATRHLLRDETFAWMKPGAHLVNVARGGLVDQDALRRALDSGRVGLATLDCVEPEPLPAGHWLYEHPQVRLSPHISWAGPESHSGLMDRFVENLERFVANEPLEYRVDPDERY